jgi:hypothetical protein
MYWVGFASFDSLESAEQFAIVAGGSISDVYVADPITGEVIA